MFLFEWRSALGMRRVALASAESNAAPKQSEARSSPTRRETPKYQCIIIGLFKPNGTVVFNKHTSVLGKKTAITFHYVSSIKVLVSKK